MYQFCMIFWKAIWDIFLCFLQDVFLWINANREWLFDGLFPSLISNTITLLLFFIGLIIKKGESKPIEPPRKNHVFDFEVIEESPPPGQSFKAGSLIVKKLTLINKSNYMWQSHSLKCVAASPGLTICNPLCAVKDTNYGWTTDVSLVFRSDQPGYYRSVWRMFDEDGSVLGEPTQTLMVDILVE